MIKKTRVKRTICSKKNRQIQISTTTNICTCNKNFDECFSLRWISNHKQLMAVIDEPIFVTGRRDWQEKELDANIRELGMCKHFLKQLTPEYLCYFVKELLHRKQNYLEKQEIVYPVTCYTWYYVCSVSGTVFLCYDFISGYNPKLPFGRKYLTGLHVHTFMRKFLDFKIKKTSSRKLYVFADVLNKEQRSNSEKFSEQECIFLYKNFWDVFGIDNG